jgi:protein-L-isoaspartate O-methyltransferase
MPVSYRFRIALFLIGGLLLIVLLSAIYQGISTLARLEVVERERDQWQRPSEIIQALNLGEGAVVVDLGSGAGYFALKLSPEVGKRGRVLAVDLRKLSLSFLWIRSLLRNLHNVTVILGDPGDHMCPGPWTPCSWSTPITS